MPDRPLKLRDRILRSFGISEDPSRGKGSHTMFFGSVEGRLRRYPIPTHSGDVAVAYVRSVRRVFRLSAADGVSDRDFYSR